VYFQSSRKENFPTLSLVNPTLSGFAGNLFNLIKIEYASLYFLSKRLHLIMPRRDENEVDELTRIIRNLLVGWKLR